MAPSSGGAEKRQSVSTSNSDWQPLLCCHSAPRWSSTSPRRHACVVSFNEICLMPSESTWRHPVRCQRTHRRHLRQPITSREGAGEGEGLEISHKQAPTGMICCRSSSEAAATPTTAFWSQGAVGGVSSFLRRVGQLVRRQQKTPPPGLEGNGK